MYIVIASPIEEIIHRWLLRKRITGRVFTFRFTTLHFKVIVFFKALYIVSVETSINLIICRMNTLIWRHYEYILAQTRASKFDAGVCARFKMQNVGVPIFTHSIWIELSVFDSKPLFWLCSDKSVSTYVAFFLIAHLWNFPCVHLETPLYLSLAACRIYLFSPSSSPP